jgi:beta-lactam-binding protein with PASTA domain
MTGTNETDDAVPQLVREPRHLVRTFFLVVLALIVLGGVGVAVGLADTAHAKVTVPNLAGLATTAASKVLAGAQLTDGQAHYFVTRAFAPGLIIAESPAPGSAVAMGSPVNVQVAVAPRQVVVPDVVFAEVATAQKMMSDQLFEPRLQYAYSKDVATGLVIEQLPRAGDTASTGSSNVLVVSLGPGSGGKTVPNLLGGLLGVARSELTSQTLFAEVRAVIATGVPDGTVVDQAPTSGTVVPVASNVTLSVAFATPPPSF